MRNTFTILAKTAEECNEVGKAIMKLFIYGEDSHHPDEPSESNLDHLIQELGDVLAMIELLRDETALGITQAALDAAKLKKHAKLDIYLPRPVGPDRG